jgi:hypothetical protein
VKNKAGKPVVAVLLLVVVETMRINGLGELGIYPFICALSLAFTTYISEFVLVMLMCVQFCVS